MRKSSNLPPLLLLPLGTGILGAQVRCDAAVAIAIAIAEQGRGRSAAHVPSKLSDLKKFVQRVHRLQPDFTHPAARWEMLAGRGLGRLSHRIINRHVIGSRGLHTEAMLVRDFVARSLYQKDKGYFTSRTVVGSVGGGGRGTGEYGLDFGNMLGKREYQVALLLKPRPQTIFRRASPTTTLASDFNNGRTLLVHCSM
jgi:hypothetical protein